MSGALSKRQQARNEKILQDLVRSVPGNNACADCQSQNPAWASWSLGIFLCMRCAAIHRKLGTHISKVKSLSMDSWSNEQVENMKKVGNNTSNRNYNPQNKRAPVPIDVDEADSAMERFIRQKYVNNSLIPARRNDTGSSESDDNPPPLPPKPASRFGFRSASSIFPLGSKAKKEAAAREPPSSPAEPSRSSPRRSKTSQSHQTFGASVRPDTGDGGTDRKLAKLRDMGFSDDQRNATILKGVNGDLDRTVETLVRLGEGRGRTAHPLTAPLESSAPAGGWSLTPAKSSSSAGLECKVASSASNNNPFDTLDMPPAQPQSSQSTGTLQNKNPYLSTNPFGMPAQQTGAALDQALQNLSLSPLHAQQLFPHHTGDVPQQQHPYQPYQQFPQQQQQQQPPQQQQWQQEFGQMFQQPSATYPMPSAPSQYLSAVPNGYPTTASPPAIQSSYNPFFASQQPQQPQPQPQLQSLAVNTAIVPNGFAGNPFTRSPTRIQSPQLTQIPEQSQQNFYNHPAPVSAPLPQAQPQAPSPAQPQTNNPFLSQPMPASPLPPRQDKASILALYNNARPTTPNNPFQMGQQHEQNQVGNAQDIQQYPPQQQQHQQQPLPLPLPLPLPQQQPQQVAQPQPAMTGFAGQRNPFLANGASSNVAGGGGVQPPLIGLGAAKHGASRDSIMALGLEWTNGRHSPDAFASLSARDMR